MSESSRTSIQMGKVHKLFSDVEEMLDDMRDHFQNQIRVLQQNLTRPQVPHNNPVQIQENIWEKPEEANDHMNVWKQHTGLSEVFNSPNHRHQQGLDKETQNDSGEPSQKTEADLEAESNDDQRMRRRRRQKVL